ncbi:MAG TPA: valine--tRNA ligase, partial [Acidimicrobiales bacterium]|nr:valine--tRNA ligase [Acidimicrobiales bacterium]
FVTEEVWSWWHEGSIHRSSWPDADELRAIAEADVADAGDEPVPEVLAAAAAVLGEIRRAKSEAKRSMRAPVASVTVTDTADRLALLALAAADVRSAGNVASLETIEGETFSVSATLAPDA